MKYFIVTDVHSFYNIMIDALDKAGFDKTNKDHIFVSLGDLLDRGNSPLQCLRFVNNLPRKILIRGNHEDLLEEAIARKNFLRHDYANGTLQTVIDLVSDNHTINSMEDVFNCISNNNELNKYLNSLQDFYEDSKNIFVHGWIPCKYDKQSDTFTELEDWRRGDWANARWINGMKAWSNNVRVSDKIVYCGHWHTSWGHKYLHNSSCEWDNPYSTNPAHRKADFSPFVDNGIVALDACTACSHKVNVYVVDTEGNEVDKWQ